MQNAHNLELSVVDRSLDACPRPVQVARSLRRVELDLVFDRAHRIVAQCKLVNEINASLNALTLPVLKRVVAIIDLVFYILVYNYMLTYLPNLGAFRLPVARAISTSLQLTESQPTAKSYICSST